MTVNILTRTAVLLTLALTFQSLRLVFPVPGLALNFIIGSLVNMVLLVASGAVGLGPALAIAWAAPVVAYLQGMLPLPIFVIPVAMGNMVYIILFLLRSKMNFWLTAGFAATGKVLFLYFTFRWLLAFLAFSAKPAAMLLAAMSWPQLITAVSGAFLTKIIMVRLEKKALV